jgi:cyclic pyranopterin phosphate synthase
MKVRVRLFAILRERAGRDSVEVELPAGATVADAMRRLSHEPGLGEPIARMQLRMAVNREYADPDTPLAAEDELALIPPISGGAGEDAAGLSHLDASGRARMVDVGAKPESERRARARARVRMSPRTAALVDRGEGPKGEVLGVARLAGVQAAKQAANLIPLAHPLPLSFADVEARVDVGAGLVELVAEARTVGRTGVEMEAMAAAAVAALTVYDMVKGVERGVAIEQVVLLEKAGGRSDWRLEEPAGG